MNSRAPLLSVAVICVLTGFVAVAPVSAEQETRPRDNSGRRIAVVVPGLPRAVPPAPVTPASSIPAAQRVNRVGSTPSRPEAPPKTKMLSNVATPAQLSPEVKQAIEKGVVVAHGLSNIAVRRASDVAAWLGTMWRQMNEVPRLSPSSEFAPPAPPVESMRPLQEPSGRSRQLYFTSERRIKTVVAQ